MTFTPAMEAWEEALGSDAVCQDPSLLHGLQQATFATSQTILAQLLPASVEEVQRCVEIAHREEIPLYPISRGRNWGLGSKVPARDGCVLLDLQRMDRIVDFDEELAYITVEPGVTFQQIAGFLRQRGSSLMFSVIGGSPHASPIGNLLERGDGIGPYGARLHHVCGLQVVLPQGQLLKTGFGRFDDALATAVSPWGVGPALEGLFTQSNFGVVTQATFWLRPRPRWFQMFIAELSDTPSLAPLLDALRPLMLQGLLQPNSVTLWNGYKFVARLMQYPWQAMQGQTPLPPAGLGKAQGWSVSGALYNISQAQGDAERAYLREALAPVVEQIGFADGHSHPELLEDNLLLGDPSNENAMSIYWRKRDPWPQEPDPDDHGCGVHWLCPELPFSGDLVAQAVEVIEGLILEFGFEPNLGIACASGRCLRMFAAIVYDRHVEGEDAKAQACHDALFRKVLEMGHYPCRLGIQSMPLLPQGHPDTMEVLRRLKSTFDPRGILAPGRYQWDPPC